MVAGFAVLFIACGLIWLVFFKLRLLRFSIAWAVGSSLVIGHLALIFMIGLRFMTPASRDASVVQRTIQLIPRLPEPTLVTDVLVDENVLVKKGTPLFKFDRRLYSDQVRQLEAQLAAAKQNVKVLKSDVDVAVQKVNRTKAQRDYALYQQHLFEGLAKRGAGTQEDAQKWTADAIADEASVKEAEAELNRSRLKYESQINGVNTEVAQTEASLAQAVYYLDNTTLVAPEDGRMINIQVRPGMVSGIIRVGGIAAFICEADRYVLATYFQENFKYVKPGQFVELAFDLYPGQIFKGQVDSLWLASGEGQYLPSDIIPNFQIRNPQFPQGQFGVKIRLTEPDPTKFPIGAQGIAAIYTDSPGGFRVLRKIGIRASSWLNYLYPLQ